MDIYNLPDDLLDKPNIRIQLYDYINLEDSIKARVNLTKNTISFLRSGIKEVYAANKNTQIENNQFLILASGHCLMTEKLRKTDEKYHSVLLFFDDAFIEKFIVKNAFELGSINQRNSFHVFDYDEYLDQFVLGLELLLDMPILVQEAILKNKLEELLLYLSHRDGLEFLHVLMHDKDDQLLHLTRVVENNIFNKLSLSELAFLCNMSLSTFKRMFKKKYNCPPKKWFDEQRLNYIAKLLKSNNTRPIDLFDRVGYENYSNFIQAFKKHFGKTPKQYQKDFELY